MKIKQYISAPEENILNKFILESVEKDSLKNKDKTIEILSMENKEIKQHLKNLLNGNFNDIDKLESLN